MIKVKTLIIGNSLKNLNHIIYCDQTRKAIISDPYDEKLICDFLEKENLNALCIINTHHHADHIKDNLILSKKLKISIIENKDQQKIYFSEKSSLRSIHTPGHVLDHYIFEIIDNGIVIGYITGDTLFNAGVGNCKNGGDINALYETTTNIIGHLEKKATIYPSHDYFLTNLKFAQTQDSENKEIDFFLEKKIEALSREELLNTTVEEELQINPFLRLKELAMYDKTLTQKEIFFKLRSLRDRW